MAAEMPKDQVILVNLSGRGDKDINTVASISNISLYKRLIDFLFSSSIKLSSPKVKSFKSQMDYC